MGWPRNKGLRLYYEPGNKTYLLVDHEDSDRGIYEAVGELYVDNNPERPALCSASAGPSHLYRKCKRASWDDMPEVWKTAMSSWIDGKPEDHRGLFRMSELPKPTAR